MDISIDLTTRPISIDRVIRRVLAEEAGGTAVFIGTVRKTSPGMRHVRSMVLETAMDLAEKDLMRIGKAAKAKFAVSKLAIHHRIGAIGLGEVIVVIAASAPHREDAFAASKYIIDELKKSTPIWKKELGGRKARWVGPGR